MMIFDDDPSPRIMKPSGKMADVTYNGARRPEVPRDLPRPPMPELRTPGQKRRFARDLLVYQQHKRGASLRALAELYALPVSTVQYMVGRVEALRIASGPGPASL